MKFEGITPEIIWANKEGIFLITLVLVFVGLLFNVKIRNQSQKGYAEVAQIHMEGNSRTKVFTLYVRNIKSPPNKRLFIEKIGEGDPRSKNLIGQRRGNTIRVYYKKNTEGKWMITKIFE